MTVYKKQLYATSARIPITTGIFDFWKLCWWSFRIGSFCIFAFLFLASILLGILATTGETGFSGAGFYSTYQYSLFFYGNSKAVREYDSFRASLYETCSPRDAELHHNTVLEQTWDVGSFYGAPLMQAKTFLNTWTMLTVVFLVSSVSEGIRLVHVMTGSGINPISREARYLRWVEYALTSPFMIIIIALSGFIRERTILLLLGVGQFALIHFGHSLEDAVENLVSEPSMHNITVLLTDFLSAWIIHISLWVFSLIPISTHNINNSLPCTGWRNTQESGDYELLKNIFIILLYGEFLLFSLFGLVLPFTFLKHIIRVQYNVSFTNLEDLWTEQDEYYNILNIFSKTLLFLLCGLIVFQMPAEVSFK